MSLLYLIEGPAGSNKSGETARMLAAGEADIAADYTQIWAGLRGIEREPDGRYPTRQDSDPAVRSGLVTYLRAVAVRQGLRLGLRVIVTSGTPKTAVKWSTVAREEGALLSLKTIDPGEATVRRRLAVDGVLDPQCEQAIGRWYN